MSFWIISGAFLFVFVLVFLIGALRVAGRADEEARELYLKSKNGDHD